MNNDLTVSITIENRIFTIRGQKVMIDRDLAQLYGVETKKLNQAVKRNIKRFPKNFMFQLNDDEQKELVTNCDHLQNLRYSYQNAYAFTEHGVTMLASVLNSDRAIEISIKIVEAFIALRQYAMLQSSKNAEIEELKKMLMLHIENTGNKLSEHDETIKQIIGVLNNLIDKPRETKRIGFDTSN